ncbi:Asp-tRNA(Asn)/Glu-tRNA(Gln) amidotransferase A subunit family amidase [Paraburkholderia sp. CI2]|uniref:hypothetical protein n=1 Tax=unclassified Paraburkholderia TaxID=2615204 RepID=UPI001609C54A|nr:hypothetical protein [Paraburkholderia sp. CI2]MBB5469748.1 Asp-tRNA(Asn)/Glu-tRNA(Gln) amidotransferase A subunit family amidase [Paraburkholderia sp. CI2]
MPACPSLDRLSIFAHDVVDAWRVLEPMAAFDALDGYAAYVAPRGWPPERLRVALPDALEFFGDDQVATAFAAPLDTVTSRLSFEPATFWFAPMQHVASRLYDGLCVAERRAALSAFFDAHRESISL